MTTTSVKIETVRILNDNTGSDPGNDLEIYGNLGAWVKRKGSDIGSPALFGHLFMDTDGHHPASITQGTELFVAGDKTVEVGDNEELWIGGHLWEQDDTSADDDMGGHYRQFPHNDLPSGEEIELFFHDHDQDQRVRATFTFS